MDYNETRIVKMVAGGVGAFILLLLLIWVFPVVVIGAGNRGVVFNNASGIENRILGEGVHVRIPFVESVKQLSIKVQKDQVDAAAASKDLQTVAAKVVVNWHLDSSKVNKIYQNIGDEKTVFDKVIAPGVNEVLKASTAKYTAEELLTKRALLKFDVDNALSDRLKDYNVILDDISVVDLDFSPVFNQAIEQKAAAVQKAQQAENDLRRIEIEAKQTVETAKAAAESIRIKAAALRENPDLVQFNAVEKWNGVLPHFVGGGTIPFIQIPNN